MSDACIIAWSGGKDSALALWKLPDMYQPTALLTNVNSEQQRSSVHGVRVDLIQAQADALGLPLHRLALPTQPTNAQYEAQLAATLSPFQQAGVQQIVYGDLFLEDIRAYRDEQLHALGWQTVYPLWQIDTANLAREFISTGFKALVVCVDTTQLDAAFVGRTLDATFLDDLPPSVDPCGENGEFHTFVYDGPLFAQPISISLGDQWRTAGRFHYCDLLPST